jgi:hypothetical protein
MEHVTQHYDTLKIITVIITTISTMALSVRILSILTLILTTFSLKAIGISALSLV